jgi:hypothetical protein
VIEYFMHRTSGKVVALLTALSLGYGWIILRLAPMWRRLAAAQDGSELQGSLGYGARDVARVFGTFGDSLRTDALLFYAVDVPNAVLFAVSIAALMGYGLRQLGAGSSPVRWALVLPLVSGASDLVENAALTTALLSSPREPSAFGALAGAATTLKLSAGYVSLALMLLFIGAALVRTAWRRWRVTSS